MTQCRTVRNCDLYLSFSSGVDSVTCTRRHSSLWFSPLDSSMASTSRHGFSSSGTFFDKMACKINVYHTDPKFSDGQVWTNNVDQMRLLLEEQFDQGLHCLPFCLHLLGAYSVIKPKCSTFRIITAKFSGVRIFSFFTVVCKLYCTEKPSLLCHTLKQQNSL